VSAARAIPVIWAWRQRLIMPRLHRPDGWLLLAAAGLVGLGVVMVFDTSYFHAQERYGDALFFFRRHLVYLFVGVAAGVLVSRMRHEVLEQAAYWLLFGAFALLILVLVPGIGVVRNNARRWIDLGIIAFQPAELAKICVVVYLARSITRKGERMASLLRGVVPHIVTVGAIVLLIIRQPDFGTAAILAVLMLLMLHAGGARAAHLLGLSTAAAVAGAVAVISSNYRSERVTCFLDPWQDPQGCGFQLVQSLIAFGSGGVSGVGLGQSQQKLFYLPEGHTDFIFALIAEELGLAGAVLVVGLFGLFAVRGFRIALRHPDPFASLLAFGLTLTIVVGAFVNMAVVTGLLPTKGLALPFLSYGGSALIVSLIQVGILCALSRRTG
jgi:cell division protein FtsW